MSDPNVPPPPSYTPPPPPPGTTPPGGVSQNRGLMIVLSYLWLLALVPLLVEKNDPEVQWHAKHGLVLTVAEIILWVGVFVVQIIATHVPFLGCIISILWFAVWIGIIILHILCIVKGVKGERFLIPGISEYANRF
ncbi:MAG TPA: hypothetical protein VLV54_17485 [Thermoanaerobaculia bacterium]|nr:hypothetical protein [Thermoanaerobaculia bacterium]